VNANWSFDLTGYVVGGAALLYALIAKRYKIHPKKISRWLWIGFGVIAIAGNIAQNIIEFQDR
jgi:hypothetical protein